MNEARYERKLVAERAGAGAVRRLVARHPAMFSPAYPPRWVNGIYFDTPLRASYGDNVEGNPDRSKMRLRWYGGLMGSVTDPVLEVKTKAGLIGGKQRFPLAPFVVDHTCCATTLAAMLRPQLPPGEAALIGSLEAVCAVRYHRDYYLSADGRFRVTVDADIAYAAIGRRRSRWHHRTTEGRRVIVEVKYDREHDPDADRISAWFPFRLARNSKYARALELLAL